MKLGKFKEKDADINLLLSERKEFDGIKQVFTNAYNYSFIEGK